MNHTLITPERCREIGGARHEDTYQCPICDGGLGVCETCGLYEGSLTSECPGEESYRLHADAVYAGDEDFRDGKWHTGMKSPACPASRA